MSNFQIGPDETNRARITASALLDLWRGGPGRVADRHDEAADTLLAIRPLKMRSEVIRQLRDPIRRDTMTIQNVTDFLDHAIKRMESAS